MPYPVGIRYLEAVAEGVGEGGGGYKSRSLNRAVVDPNFRKPIVGHAFVGMDEFYLRLDAQSGKVVI